MPRGVVREQGPNERPVRADLAVAIADASVVYANHAPTVTTQDVQRQSGFGRFGAHGKATMAETRQLPSDYSALGFFSLVPPV